MAIYDFAYLRTLPNIVVGATNDHASVAANATRVGALPTGRLVDAADEVHVHGYDFSSDVEAGDTVTIEFTADIAGVFEVELEDARLPILELVVEP